jgi:hypothetical protein
MRNHNLLFSSCTEQLVQHAAVYLMEYMGQLHYDGNEKSEKVRRP